MAQYDRHLVLALLAALAVSCEPRGTDTASTQVPGGGPDTGASPARVGRCSREHELPLESFEHTPGARGSVSVHGQVTAGWMLFDTGTTRTKVRGSASDPATSVELRLGGFVEAHDVGFEPFTGIRAPDGGQLALLGTDLFKDFAVRVDGPQKRLWLSRGDAACSADELREAGFVRMDAKGYFHDDVAKAPWESVGNFLAPNVPAIEIDFQGQRVRAQIDTGYGGPTRQMQINGPLRALVAGKLGPQVDNVTFGTAQYPRFRPSDATVGVVVETATGDLRVVTVDAIEVLEKNDGESIAAWGTPAAMLSASVLDAAFSVVELRADQASVWGKIREPGGAK